MNEITALRKLAIAVTNMDRMDYYNYNVRKFNAKRRRRLKMWAKVERRMEERITRIYEFWRD